MGAMSFDTGIKEKVKAKKKKKSKEKEEDEGFAKKKSSKYNVLHLEEMVDNLSIQNSTLVGLGFRYIFQPIHFRVQNLTFFQSK